MFTLVLIVAAMITYSSIEGIYERISEKGIISMLSITKLLINGTIAMLSSSLALYTIKRMFDNGSGLIITGDGMTDNSGLVPTGKILWEEVESIGRGKTFFSECVSVQVKYPLKFIKQENNIFKRRLLEREHRRAGTPVNIAVASLKIKYNELFNLIQQHFLAAKIETGTSAIRQEKEIIQQEKKALIDSINYAKRIQTALLPPPSTIAKRLGENFILLLPKDIVSGDFYWVEQVNEWIFFAVCDCTGHGVPGALISIVCHNALNRAVKEYNLSQPAKILDKVAVLVAESIGQDGEVKDGMDASLCAFNKNTRELFWAGANLPLWIARQNAMYELLEFKPDKQPIGVHQNRTAYNQHKIEIEKNDILYLFSDGYADQFGGEKGKKLTRKKLKEIILKQRNVTLEEQYKNLLTFHQYYKGSIEQIDDILIMGIKIET